MDGLPRRNVLQQLPCLSVECIDIQTCVDSDKTRSPRLDVPMGSGGMYSAMQHPIAPASRFPSRSKQSRLLSRRIRFRSRMPRTTYLRLAVFPGKHRIAYSNQFDTSDHRNIPSFTKSISLLENPAQQCAPRLL